MRVEVFSREQFPDGRAKRLLQGLRRAVSQGIRDLIIVDVFVLDEIPADAVKEIFFDPVTQEIRVDGSAAAELAGRWDFLVEVTVKPGVTDPVALTAREALRGCLPGGVSRDAIVQTGIQYLVSADAAPGLSVEELARFFHNPLIQSAVCITRGQWDEGSRPPNIYPCSMPAGSTRIERFDLVAMSDEELVELSKRRLLALSREEMRAVRAYFASPEVARLRVQCGLTSAATDVELEMIAQTWSEHCKHKIFNATIHYSEGGSRPAGGARTIRSLFQTYIKGATEKIRKKRRFLRSVFHDNSGVIAFDRSTLICFKVETHNSPSALDPYGGAITGIVGVNRDILGTGVGAKPIFNTDVLCFGFPDTPRSQVPTGLLHPRRVLEGVHRGIVDGGNQSGIPVVAGAFLFDESFLGKPLVFCGTGGVLPARVRGRKGWAREVAPGDLAVMVGGRIGKDGIHGATFSSEPLSETSPTSAVQIGDPITQKKMLDFLLEARDRGLFRGLTDNGAGGLSSSLGEMALLSGGVRIDLDKCPLKYQGLSAWEILVSESQERMSVAVPSRDIEEFLLLAGRRDVEATVVGDFTGTGHVEVFSNGSLVGLLSLDFLHDGLPVMELRAEWKTPAEAAPAIPVSGLPDALIGILADPNVASKEEWVRQYDHEVQARSVVKPFVGRMRDAPSDGGVLRVRTGSWRGITVTHGICPAYSDHDTYDMAQCAVDEAVRAHVALGGDPTRMSALDNFCWPDPVESPENPDGAFKLAQLVRACRGLADACVAYQIPLISGKDSMKNDACVGGKRISIRPTLLVSLLGIIPDIRRAMTTDFKAEGDLLYVVGETRGELGGTRFEKFAGTRLGRCPSVRTTDAFASFRKLFSVIHGGLVRSCHDLSDGGLWAALAESCMGGDVGALVSLDAVPAPAAISRDPSRLLFSETPSRFLVSVSPALKGKWISRMAGVPCARIGETAPGKRVRILHAGMEIADMGLDEIRNAWKGRIQA